LLCLLLSLLRHRLDHLHQRLLRHVAFMLEGGHLVLLLYAGHLSGHDLDLLVIRTRPTSSAYLLDVALVGYIPARHVFFGVDWVWWSLSRRWPSFIALVLGGKWPSGAQNIPATAGNMKTSAIGKPEPPWAGTKRMRGSHLRHAREADVNH
jgi:hypothetical protein